MDLISHASTGALIASALVPDGAPPTSRAAFVVAGAIAGVAPDLDALFELSGKLAGWRYHRVALHGAPTAAVLAAALFLVALATPAAAAGAGILLAAIFGAVASHLALDVVTSFGTALLFPFSRRRFTTRTHFIVDPAVLLLLGIGLASGRPGPALAGVVAWGGLAAALRAAATARARRALAALGVAAPVRLEPGPFAPWRWLAIAELDDAYLIAPATPAGAGPWHRTSAGLELEPLARRHPLLVAFLETCDSPRFELRHRELIVEDVKWWLALPFRPLAFAARLEAGAPQAPRQSRLFDRDPSTRSGKGPHAAQARAH